MIMDEHSVFWAKRLVEALERANDLQVERNKLLEESVALQRESWTLQLQQAAVYNKVFREEYGLLEAEPTRPDAGKAAEVEKP